MNCLNKLIIEIELYDSIHSQYIKTLELVEELKSVMIKSIGKLWIHMHSMWKSKENIKV